MKKLLVMLLTGVLLCSVTACGNKATNKDNGTKQEEQQAEAVAESSVEILEKVWASFGEEQKFAIYGGDTQNNTSDAPAKFDISNVDELNSTLGVPQDLAEQLDDAASMVHMMNANNFTAGAYHLKDAANLESFTTGLKDSILARQWMCGFPDTLVIYTLGEDYVVSVFGGADNIVNLKANLTAAYPDAVLAFEENISEM